MKVLHVIDSGGLYGAEVMLLNLMEAQVKLGLEPVLGSIGKPCRGEKPLELEARRRGLEIRCFPMRPGPNLAGALEIVRYARRSGMQLVHSHGYKGNILLGFLPARLRRLPLIATVHGWTWSGGLSRMMLYEWLDALSLSRMDRVVLVNAAMLEHPRIRKRLSLPVEVVVNGIGRDSEAVAEDGLDSAVLEFCRNRFVVGAVGRLSPEKGYDILLQAVAKLVGEGSDLHLVLLGEGKERVELERQTFELGLKGRVLMPGYVDSARDYLRLFDLFVISSHTEGLPMVLLEAMQARVPVISSAVGGIPYVLEQGDGGLLVAPGSPQALAQGIAQVLADPQKAAQRAAKARDCVERDYSSEAMAARYLDVYRKVQG